MLRKALIPAAAVILALLCGCQQGELVGGAPREKLNPGIVSLSPSTTEMTNKMGIFGALLGRSESCNWPVTVTKSPVVVKGTSPDYEKIISLKPDVILYDSALFSADQVKKFTDVGLKTIGWDPKTLKEYETQAFEMSHAVGGEMNLSEYIDTIYRHAATSKAALEDAGGKSPKIAILIGRPGQYMAAGTTSFWADLVSQAGGTIAGPKADKFEPVSLEGLIKDNPEVIVAAGNGASILSDPTLKPLLAIKNKLVFDINQDVLLRRGGRVDLLMEAIGTALVKAATKH